VIGLKAGDGEKAESRDGRATSSKDILGNHVETDRRLLDGTRSGPGFRGDILLLPLAPTSEAVAGLYGRVEKACAPQAIAASDGGLTIDKGRCIMCGVCQEMAPDAFKLENRFARPAARRRDLVIAQLPAASGGSPGPSLEKVGSELSEKIKKVLGRSLAIREVDAGSCNGCEVEVAALNNPIYDVERYGVHFVASPRHADVLLVTGVASRNMESALRRTYEATPDPKVVVAVGACACSGGIFGDSYASSGGIDRVVPVDVYVPGCPPRPEALVYGLLLAVDRVG
jgi:Ni,Fe-hydrogenase III small subunit